MILAPNYVFADNQKKIDYLSSIDTNWEGPPTSVVVDVDVDAKRDVDVILDVDAEVDILGAASYRLTV
jgi:hypothetical protein